MADRSDNSIENDALPDDEYVTSYGMTVSKQLDVMDKHRMAVPATV
jgi:hypothetical protein